MTKEGRNMQHKLKVLRYGEKTGHLARTCRYFGLGRSIFYRWKAAYDQCGEAGLVNAKSLPSSGNHGENIRWLQCTAINDVAPPASKHSRSTTNTYKPT